MITSDIIYSEDNAGKIRTWQYEVEGNKWRSIAGLQDGKKVVAKWTECKRAKSRPTVEEQAQFEAQAQMDKRLDRDYRRTIEELKAVLKSPMLADKYKDHVEEVDTMLARKGVFSQPKLDGFRAFMRKDSCLSRSFQQHFNVEHIVEVLRPFFEKYPNAILDGELYNHEYKDNFNKISSVIRKEKANPLQKIEAAELIQFHIYDLPSQFEFWTRNEEVDAIFDYYKFPPCIQRVRTDLAQTQEQMDEIYAQYIADGYEGQMLRDPNGLYEYGGRPVGLLKRKEFEDREFKLLRIEEGKGNWAGLAKRVFVEHPPGQEAKAGLKGNMAFAKELLAKEIGPDDEVTVRFQGFTPDGEMRFPVAVDFHWGGRKD